MGRDIDGKSRRHTEIVRGTKRQAESRERDLLQARQNGTYVEPNRLTVRGTSWLEKEMVGQWAGLALSVR